MALTTGLVSYWKLNEASGTRADSHGANNLTDSGGTTSATGKIGDAAHFVATESDDLSIADNATLAFTTALSVSFWLKQTDLALLRTFVGKWTYATDGEWTITAGAGAGGNDAGDIRIHLATTATDPGTNCDMRFNDVGMTAGSWFHVVVVYDGSLSGDANRLKVWVNNTAKTLTVGAGAVPATLRNGGATLYLGRWGGTLTRYYNGDMDEVGLWNRALTSTEVGILYNSGNGYPYSSIANVAQSQPGRADEAVGHGQFGLASALRTFGDLAR